MMTKRLIRKETSTGLLEEALDCIDRAPLGLWGDFQL